MTIIEIKEAIDAAIVAVNAEVDAAAQVPPYPSETYSTMFRSRMTEVVRAILDPEEFVTDILFSPHYKVCTSEGFLVLEFSYDDGLAGSHKVRYEILDRFFQERR